MDTAQRKTKHRHSMQLTFIGIFSLFIAMCLALLSIFPITSARDLMFSAKRRSLLGQAEVISSSLAALEKLSGEGVEQVMELLYVGGYDRVVVTDRDGMILYDMGRSTEAAGSYSAAGVTDNALLGLNTFACQYTGAAFFSRAAVPVMSYGYVIGSVYLYEVDEGQALLIRSIQTRLRGIALSLGLVMLAVLVLFTRALTRRLRELVRGMRIVREGDYAYRVEPQGADEVTELTEEFNDMTGRLQTTEELRRRFVSDASHELRTPLASILLLSDSILQSENMDEGTMREFVSDIGTEAARLQRMTEKLLRLTKMDAAVSAQRGPVNLKRVIERAHHLLEPLAQTRGVTIYTDLAEDCLVFASEDDLYQVVFNLAENAIKYNCFGGNVFLRLDRDGETVVLSVEDTGIGIPKEDLPHVFERFYRVDKGRSRATGGSGLGLSIVLGAVEQNGGSIRVEPRDTVGTRFVVRFPLLGPAEPEKEEGV